MTSRNPTMFGLLSALSMSISVNSAFFMYSSLSTALMSKLTYFFIQHLDSHLIFCPVLVANIDGSERPNSQLLVQMNSVSIDLFSIVWHNCSWYYTMVKSALINSITVRSPYCHTRNEGRSLCPAIPSCPCHASLLHSSRLLCASITNLDSSQLWLTFSLI